MAGRPLLCPAASSRSERAKTWVTQAADGQILIDGRVQLAVEAIASTEPIGDLDLKGFHRPVRAFNVRDLVA